MRRVLLLVLAVLASSALLSPPPLLSPSVEAATVDTRGAAPPWTWRTVYEDDFSGTRLNRAWSRYDAAYGSGEQNYARPDHFYLNGRGKLVLLMKYRTSGDDGAAWYTGGAMLNEKYGGRFQIIDIRYKVVSDGVQSRRNIPMRWVDDPDYQWYEGESDFNEGSSLDSVTTFLHYGPTEQVSKNYRVDMTTWHRWRFVHRPDRQVRVYLDGRLKWSYQGTEATVPDAFRRVVLQQEVSGSNYPSSTSGSERILVDHIKIRTSSAG